MGNITMAYIARIAGVSKSTVSRALSDDPRVNEKTRKKIKKIAEELDYKPNKVAQALATNNTNVIGVILPQVPRSVADPFFLEFLQGIGEVAIAEGYSLTLPNIARNRLEDLAANCNNNKVDGVILTEPAFNDPRIKYFRKEQIPFVFLGNPMDKDDICWVETDNESGAFQAVKYLIESGHSRIATITGPLELVAGKYRYYGYKKALKEKGIKISSDLIVSADFTQQGAYRATIELLNRTRDFTAIFVANDLMAIGVIRALKDNNISIPDQVAVMGYDGIQIGEYIDPPLSTIKLPSNKMGKVAMEILLGLIKGNSVKKKHILLPPELVIRKST